MAHVVEILPDGTQGPPTLPDIVNSMAVDDLAMQGTRVSGIMLLAKLTLNVWGPS